MFKLKLILLKLLIIGHDTKIMMNSINGIKKQSKIEKILNI